MSPSAQLTSDFDDVELRIKILTPTFYSEFIRHPTSLSALITLSESGESITISHPELLTTLDLDSVPHHQKVNFKEGLQWRVLQRLRPFKSVKDDEDVGLNVSSFEKFIITHCEAVERKEYVWRVSRFFLASHLALGWVEILDLEIFVGKAMIIWGIVSLLW